MAKQTINLALAKSAMISESLPDYTVISDDSYRLINNPDIDTRMAVLGFEPFPSALRHNRLYSVAVKCYVKSEYNMLGTLPLYRAPESISDFSPSSTTWNSVQGRYWHFIGTVGIAFGSDIGQYIEATTPDMDIAGTADAVKEYAPELISKPIGLRGGFYLSVNNDFPLVLVVEYDDAITVPSQIIADNNTTGYVNPHEAQTFYWHYEENDPDGYHAMGPIEQASAVFYWRVGATGDWNQIAINSSQESVTIPAETFTGGSVITWKVSGTDTVGQVSETPVNIITIVDSLRTSSTISPVSAIVPDAEPTVFQWTSSNSHGTAQTGADLQYSFNGGAWTDLAHIDGASTEYTAAIGTFEAGNYQWRVRTYNVDGNAGNWSPAAAFIYMAAPVVQSLYATPVPFSLISWQAVNQQAYNIAIDGENLGTFFGDSKEFQLTEFLNDGPHSVTVKVQNIFSLWSDPVTYTFTVSNVQGQAVELAAAFEIDAALSWETESTDAQFLIYRDDQKIGSTGQLVFTDRFVLGQHSYYVINVLPGGYYTKSNVVTGTMKACTTVIDTLQDPSGWMELRLTANDPDEQIISYQRTASLRHFTGSVYPVLELAKYEDGSGTYDVAFPDLPSAQAFEALKGKVVIIKSRGGNVVIGALLQLQKRVGDFFIAFDFTVQRIAWEDFVDDQNG